MCVYDRFTMSDDEDVVYVRTEFAVAPADLAEEADGGMPADLAEEADGGVPTEPVKEADGGVPAEPVEGASGGAPADPVKKADDEVVICSICLCSDVNCTLGCKHRFHAKCLVNYFIRGTEEKAGCPYCRQKVEKETEFDVWGMVGPADLI